MKTVFTRISAAHEVEKFISAAFELAQDRRHEKFNKRRDAYSRKYGNYGSLNLFWDFVYNKSRLPCSNYNVIVNYILQCYC